LIAFGKTLSHGAQPAQQASQSLTPHRDFFSLPSAAFGQNVEFAFMLVQLHLHRVAHLLPRQIEPFLLMLLDASFGRAYQIEGLSFRIAHLLQNRFGRYSAIHHPHAPRFAVGRFDLR
jgi:hypothetical protein